MTVEEARDAVENNEEDFYATLLFDALYSYHLRSRLASMQGKQLEPKDIAEIVLGAYEKGEMS